uniref:E4 n=1 Tax=Human papillomavirus TaxID=10566 RepID=A0A1Q1PPG6_9PAPI|nr:E4 [Human papillomavirus]
MKEHILWKGQQRLITLHLQQMQPDMAKQDIGKCMLIRTLCLLLLLALRRQLETGPPSTPFPGPQHPPPHNGQHHVGLNDTDEKPPALQPPPRGRRASDKKKPHDPQGPDQVPVQGRGTKSDGDEPSGTAPNPPTGEGEGAVEGGPSPGRGPVRDPDLQGLLPGVASRLQTWENLFEQLVDDITRDLRNYWQMLRTPQ